MIPVSIVVPTLRRPAEVDELLTNLAALVRPPRELILVDAGPPDDTRTQELVERRRVELPFSIVHVPHARGTAIQRNGGIDRATSDFIAMIDDDVRVQPDFFEVLLAEFAKDTKREVGTIVGFRTNQQVLPDVGRWRMYKALRLLSVFEAGRYDYENGYPINPTMQPPFTGTREVDFVSGGLTLWRREVFADGLRFDPFFADYGLLEDAHLALSAKRRGWRLLQSGDAHCVHLHSPTARSGRRLVGKKSVVNYYYVFESIAGPLTPSQKARFWRFQAFELMRLAASSVRRRRMRDLEFLLGKLEGAALIARNRWA
jgi:GT2 family glycosyltransferase